jgi:hypothetical protein
MVPWWVMGADDRAPIPAINESAHRRAQRSFRRFPPAFS